MSLKLFIELLRITLIRKFTLVLLRKNQTYTYLGTVKNENME